MPPYPDPPPQQLPTHPFGGVVGALVTPFRDEGEPDEAAMEDLCRRCAEGGCDGLFVLGSTGELPLLDEPERRRVTTAARSGCPPQIRLLVGVSGLGLKHTIRNARNAASDGADAVVVMAPFFPRIGDQELTAYLRAVADGSPVPIALYHHMGLPTPIDPESVLELAGHPNIVAIKDTSDGTQRMGELLAACGAEDVAILQGREPMILESLHAGAHGCVTALAGVVPEWHARLVRAHDASDQAIAELYQQAITTLWKLFPTPAVRESFFQFTDMIKALLQHRGWPVPSACSHPGFTPDPELRTLARQYFDEAAAIVHEAPASMDA